MITNASKAVVWRAKLEAFDRSVLTTSIGDFNIGLTAGFLPYALTGHAAHVQNRSCRFCPGQYWDAEKQSWYNYFRDYDATLGRYLQSDPIDLAGGLNTYGYVLGNPVIYIDETARAPEKPKFGQWQKVEGTNYRVRIDRPTQPNQQTHAHVEVSPGKETVLNKDGTGSHGSCPEKELPKNKKLLNFLRGAGFQIGILMTIQDAQINLMCSQNPFDPICGMREQEPIFYE